MQKLGLRNLITSDRRYTKIKWRELCVSLALLQADRTFHYP